MKSMNKKQRKIKISLEKFCLENDLGYVLEEWDYENNDGKTPKDYSYGSQIRRHWICKLGHKWECVIGHRTSTTQKDKCPYCSNHKLLKGFNDLRTKYPEIAVQWHPSKNGQLTPEDTMYGSNLKIWWKCSRGHECDYFTPKASVLGLAEHRL